MKTPSITFATRSPAAPAAKFTQCRRPVGALALAAMLGGGVIGPASASDFLVGVLDNGGFPICTTLGPSPTSGIWSNNTSGFGFSSALATAAGGVQGGTAAALSTGSTVALNSNFACFMAETVIDDVVISGPGPTASIQVSADLVGIVNTTGLNATNGTAIFLASIQIGEDSGSGVFFHPATLTQFTPPTYPSNSTELINTTLTTSAITLPTSSTIVVRMILSGLVNASDNFATGSATSNLDFTNGMSFPTSGPVFTLPAGFTANSLTGNIVNNQFNAPKVGPVSYCTSGTSASGCNALLSASGTPSATAASGFTLSATAVEGDKDGLYFFGTNGRQANPWGNGTSLQCVATPVRRAGILTGTGTIGLCDGAFAQDLNARWTAQPAQNPGAGAVVQAQLWYRDPQNTSNQTTSLSDAIEFTVCP